MADHVEILSGPNFRMIIDLPDGRRVFMRLDRYGYSEFRSLAVVVADAERFLELWRASERALLVGLARQSPHEWRAHRKYASADTGFARSAESAVPLARIERVVEDVEAKERVGLLRWRSVRRRQPRVEFLDGVTRTIWLLANGATRIPFDCGSLAAAEQLYDSVGAEGSALYIPNTPEPHVDGRARPLTLV